MISSHYPDTNSTYNDWNREVTLDAETVKRLFPNFKELVVPAGQLGNRGLESMRGNICDLIAALKDCKVNIVLNTHGVPGKYDIDPRVLFWI